MDNGHFDPRETPDSEALPAELQALYRHLERDGALWRTQTRAHVGEIERALKAETSALANPSTAPVPAQRPLSFVDSEAVDTEGAPFMALRERSRSTRRRTGILSVLAAVVVVALLALTFRGFVDGRSSGPLAGPTPAASQPAKVGGWETLDKRLLQAGPNGTGAPAIAPSNPDVVYETFNRQDANGVAEAALRRTDDTGRTWHELTLPADPKQINFLSAFVSPLDAHVVYIQFSNPTVADCTPGNTSTARVGGYLQASGSGFCSQEYFSTDGGAHWAPVRLPVPGVLSAPGLNPPLLLAQGTRLYSEGNCVSGPCTRLLTSTDGGKTWLVIDSALKENHQIVCDFAAAATGTRIFAITSLGNCDRLDQHARVLWRSDDAGAHWTRAGTLPTANEHGIFATSQDAGQQPLLYAILPKTIGHQNDKTGYPQPITSEAPGDLMISQNGGKTWTSAPTAGIPTSQVMYFEAFGVLGDGSIMVPFTDKGYENVSPQPPLTLYSWRPGATSWTRLTQVPGNSAMQFFLVTPQTRGSTDGKDTLWLVAQDTSPATSGGGAYWVARYRIG
jgi:hypothetical protein